MTKYKALYQYIGNTLDVYFKCEDNNADYITLFILDFTNTIWDNKRPINFDNIISNFYRVNIYADILKEEIAKIEESMNQKLIASQFDVLQYQSVFNIYNFIKHCRDDFNDLFLTPYNIKVTFLIRDKYKDLDVNNRYTSKLLLDIINSTLLYWDD